MKECNKCHLLKERTEFYAAKSNRDGLLGECKQCTRDRVTARRAENIDAVRAYDRKRGKEKHRIKQSVEMSRRWRSEDSRRAAAHSAVARAVRSGELVKKPCERCGSENSLAHHENYDRKLDVKWLCQPHHKQRHKDMVLEGIDP